MKKMNVEFWGGFSTILLSLQTGKIFSYEQDHEVLHGKYGGKQYYSSRSGLSGAGFLCPANRDNDLMQLGLYRPECGEQSFPLPLKQFPQVYVPFISHKGISRDHPCVIVTGGNNRVVLCSPDLVRKYLAMGDREISELPWKEVSISYHPLYVGNVLGVREHKISVYYDYDIDRNSRGVRLTRFCPPPKPEFTLPDVPPENENFWAWKMNLYPLGGRLFAHIHQDGYCDLVVEDKPGSGPLPDGWVEEDAPTGLYYWRTKGEDVQTFIVRHRKPEYQHSSLPDDIHYEENFPRLRWWAEREKCFQELEEKLLVKAEKDLEYAQGPEKTAEKLLERMILSPFTEVSIEDSIAAGNCRIGTLAFCRKYHLPESIPFGKLVEHPEIGEMLQNYHFAKTCEMVMENQN